MLKTRGEINEKLILMLSLVVTSHIMATRVIVVRSTNLNNVERDIDITVSQKNLYITCITIDELEEDCVE